MEIEYLNEPYEIVESPVVWKSLTGYGKKLATNKVVKLPNGVSRRVYATCYSNAASHWIILHGKKLFLK